MPGTIIQNQYKNISHCNKIQTIDKMRAIPTKSKNFALRDIEVLMKRKCHIGGFNYTWIK